jgi:radical SAM protein with 4Fe4S-binding SPASM domain
LGTILSQREFEIKISNKFMNDLRDKLAQSKSFCLIPWIHLHVMPDSSVIPCCVAPYDDIFGDLKKQSIEEIWNSPRYQELRKAMLNGEKSSSCKHCYDVEATGFPSMRNTIWSRFHHHIHVVEKTSPQGNLPEINLKYIDVRFSNLCNFKCLGCSPALSSAWFDDHQKLFNYSSEKTRVLNVADDAPVFWKQLKSMIPDAEEIYFGGGEPLITKEHFEVLQLLIESKRTDVKLSYNTNLSTLTYGRWNLAELWDKFNRVLLGISIDDMGPRAEYFRHGTKWENIVTNLRLMQTKYPKVLRYVNCTVSWMNAYYLPDLYRFLVSENFITPEGFNVNMLLTPHDLSLQALPKNLKASITGRLKLFQSELMEEGPVGLSMMHKISNIIRYMNEKSTWEQEKDLLRERIIKLDNIRGTSFPKTYPELSGILDG